MTDNTDIERRTLLRAITAASGTALSLALPSRQAGAQPGAKAAAGVSHHFETAEVKIGSNTIFIRRYGKGSPLLMVHGFPRTSLMWRHMAPQLANDHTVIASTSAAMAAAVSPPPPRIITLIRSGRWRTNLSR
jgi:haloacetate dehalogenase